MSDTNPTNEEIKNVLEAKMKSLAYAHTEELAALSAEISAATAANTATKNAEDIERVRKELGL